MIEFWKGGNQGRNILPRNVPEGIKGRTLRAHVCGRFIDTFLHALPKPYYSMSGTSLWPIITYLKDNNVPYTLEKKDGQYVLVAQMEKPE
jgi:hypothetical protein